MFRFHSSKLALFLRVFAYLLLFSSTFECVKIGEISSGSTLKFGLDGYKDVLLYPNKIEHRDYVIFLTLEAKQVNSALKNLSPDVQRLYLSILQPRDHHEIMDISPIENLTRLDTLWIVPDVPQSEVSRVYSVTILFWSQTGRSLNISHLCINLPVYGSSNINNLTDKLEKLEVLDLGGTLSISDKGLLDRIIGSLEGKPLRVLSLRKFQSISFEFAKQNINLTNFLWPIRQCPLEYLDISDNGILTIAPGFYLVTKQIKILDVSKNNLIAVSDKQLPLELLLHPSVVVIKIDYQGDRSSSFSSKKKRSMTSNGIAKSPLVILKRCLNKLNMTINDIIGHKENFCKVLVCIRPEAITGIPCEILPSFEEVMSFLDGSCDWGVRIPIAKNLKVLSASHLSLAVDNERPTSKTKVCFNTNKLEKISFGGNTRLIRDLYIEEYLRLYVVTGLDHVEEMDLSDNELNISIDDSKYIQSFKQLKNFTFSGNLFEMKPNTKFCINNTLLENIDISNNNLSTISVNLVLSCKNVKTLDLSKNKITKVILAFHEHADVALLNLSHNRINSLSKEMRDSMKMVANQSQLVVDLSNNPLFCGCTQDSIDTVSFIQMASQFNIVFHRMEHYECFAKFNSLLLKNADVEMIQHNCFPSKLYIYLLTSISNFSVICIVVSVILIYKYRYRIYTFNLKCCRKCCFKNKALVNGQSSVELVYDAFVSYSAEDRFWVHGVLMKELENKYGFKLCIHYRDFPAHGDIADVIVDHIKKSRSIIVILSEYSLQSHWCDFELKNAHTQSLIYNKPFIVIKMGKLPRNLVNGLVEDLLSSQVYIEWPDSNKRYENSKDTKVLVQKQQIFWEKVVAAIYGETYNSCVKCCGSYQRYSNLALIDDCNDLFI